MVILNKEVIITDLRVIYVGLKKGWLTPKQVVFYHQKGGIVLPNEILLEIYSISIESNDEFINIFEKKNLGIDLDEVDIEKDYYLFWAIEFLLQIVEENIGKVLKLEKVSLLYMDFNYPCHWNDFIYYMPPQRGKSTGQDALYNNLLNYIEVSIKKIRSKKDEKKALNS